LKANRDRQFARDVGEILTKYAGKDEGIKSRR
jgi:hypothetical protein